MRFYRRFLIAAATILTIVPTMLVITPATAQETASTGNLVYEDYPKPWPFRNLVNPGKLTVAVTPDIPPATFIDPATGKVDGFIVVLWEMIAKDLGIELDMVSVEWATVLPGLAANRFDLGCAGAAWNQERLLSPNFLLSNPIQVTAVVGLTLKSSGINTWTDTVDKRMGGVRGEIYLEDGVYYLKEVASTSEFPGPQEGLLALSNSQVDFLMMNLVQAGYYMENSPQADSLALIAEPLALYPESLCVNAQEADLLTAINILLGNYRSDGSYAKVVMEFMGNTEMLDGLPLLGY